MRRNAFLVSSRAPGSLTAVMKRNDDALSATLTFVLCMGAAFVVGWFLMFALLRERF